MQDTAPDVSRDELNGVSKGKKEEEAEMNARRLGCGDSVDIHIKTRGSEKTEDTGTKGREQGERFCLRRRAGAGGGGRGWRPPATPHSPHFRWGRNILPQGPVPHLRERGARRSVWEACSTKTEPSEVQGTD